MPVFCLFTLGRHGNFTAGGQNTGNAMAKRQEMTKEQTMSKT
jgi:hypothetical protein